MFQHLPATSNCQSTHPMTSASNTPSYFTQPPINTSPAVVQPSNIHSMQTRSKSGIFKPKVYSYSHTALASSINEVEPIADPRWKLQWRLSMMP